MCFLHHSWHGRQEKGTKANVITCQSVTNDRTLIEGKVDGTSLVLMQSHGTSCPNRWTDFRFVQTNWFYYLVINEMKINLSKKNNQNDYLWSKYKAKLLKRQRAESLRFCFLLHEQIETYHEFGTLNRSFIPKTPKLRSSCDWKFAYKICKITSEWLGWLHSNFLYTHKLQDSDQ